MSNKKQVSLFTFFSKTPKVQKQASENSAITTSEVFLSLYYLILTILMYLRIVRLFQKIRWGVAIRLWN